MLLAVAVVFEGDTCEQKNQPQSDDLPDGTDRRCHICTDAFVLTEEI